MTRNNLWVVVDQYAHPNQPTAYVYTTKAGAAQKLRAINDHDDEVFYAYAVEVTPDSGAAPAGFFTLAMLEADNA